MSNIDKRAYSVSQIIADLKLKHGSGDTYAPIMRWDELLALLDELEAKDNRINRLEAIVSVAEHRNALMREWKRALKVPCDLVDDQVPVVIHGMVIRLERLKETEAKLEVAEKRIAELEVTQGKPVMFIDGDISPADADKLAAVIREFNEETETPAARMARIIRENPHPTNMCDMPAAAAGKGE